MRYRMGQVSSRQSKRVRIGKSIIQKRGKDQSRVPLRIQNSWTRYVGDLSAGGKKFKIRRGR